MSPYRFRGPKPIFSNAPASLDRLPPVRWWFVGPKHDRRYRRLRGWSAFQLAAQCRVDVRDWDDIGPGNLLPDGSKVTFKPGGHRLRFWVGNPGTASMLKMFRSEFGGWPAHRRPRLVVDVTFNVAELEGVIGGVDSDDQLFAHDAEISRSYWREHLGELTGMVRLADAVTTPYEEWASPLTLLNDHVEVLPDLVDEAQAPAFLATVARLFGDEELIR